MGYTPKPCNIIGLNLAKKCPISPTALHSAKTTHAMPPQTASQHAIPRKNAAAAWRTIFEPPTASNALALQVFKKFQGLLP